MKLVQFCVGLFLIQQLLMTFQYLVLVFDELLQVLDPLSRSFVFYLKLRFNQESVFFLLLQLVCFLLLSLISGVLFAVCGNTLFL